MKSDWEHDKLSDRAKGCIGLLLGFLESGRLPQYFNPKNNLLEDNDAIANDVLVIKKFLRNPPQLLIPTA